MSKLFADAERSGTVLGRSVERIEDRILVTGKGRFAADISFPNQLHMRIVRSPSAHGRLLSVDTSEALAMPGIVAVWTRDDIGDMSVIDFRDPSAEALNPYRQPLLAKDRVRYVGEPVAAIFAEDPYLAEDAADGVLVDIDELPPLMRADVEPGEFADGVGSEPLVLGNAYGDLDAAFANAAFVMEMDLSIGRHSGVPMETRGAIGHYDAEKDILTLYGAAKVPHRNRDGIARMMGRTAANTILREGHTGGGFGIRGEIYPEDMLVLNAAMRLNRPAKWIEDRREHLCAANHSRQQRHKLRAACDAQGRIIGLDDVFFHDQGAYVRTHGARVPDMTMGMLPGPYRIPAYRATAHFRLTNKTPAATYRGPGRYEGTFVRERLMDAIAVKLGEDRVEIRRRNLVSKEEMPYTRAMTTLHTAMVLDSGDYHSLLDKTLAHVGWDRMKADAAARRAKGEMVGLGLAYFIEKTGLGPEDTARVHVFPNGDVEVITGGASIGQGFETTMAQICAEALGVDYRRVTVIHGQTDRIANGIGAHASRATVMTGSATHVASTQMRARLLKQAAELLQTPEDALEIVNGEVVRRDRSGPSISIGDIAGQAGQGGIEETGTFHTDHMTYPYGLHLAQVCVDPGTGNVKVERYAVAYDVGRAVNPMMIHGQISGGFAQGLGGALFEEFLYGEQGEPLSLTFADYLIPTAHDVCNVDVLILEEAPSPLNPLGLKGAGEAGVNAVGGAIASAIDDAIGIPGAVTQLPVTPQRLMALLQLKK